MASTVERDTLFSGKVFDIERMTQRLPDGRTRSLEVMRHPGAVAIVSRVEDGRAVMIRNDRAAVGQALWELPAGTLEPGENPRETARRELEEETGYRPGAVESIGSFYTSPGVTDERMWICHATDLTHVGQKLEEDESIEVELVEPGRLLEMVEAGEIMDGKSIAGLLLAARRGLLES